MTEKGLKNCGFLKSMIISVLLTTTGQSTQHAVASVAPAVFLAYPLLSGTGMPLHLQSTRVSRLLARLMYVLPSNAPSCLKSFPSNDTFRQNVLTDMTRVFNTSTFKFYHLRSPPPLQESTNDIRATLSKLNSTTLSVALQLSP